jgi:hypothetical protein
MNPAQAPVVGSGSPRALGSGAGEPRSLRNNNAFVQGISNDVKMRRTLFASEVNAAHEQLQKVIDDRATHQLLDDFALKSQPESRSKALAKLKSVFSSANFEWSQTSKPSLACWSYLKLREARDWTDATDHPRDRQMCVCLNYLIVGKLPNNSQLCTGRWTLEVTWHCLARLVSPDRSPLAYSPMQSLMIAHKTLLRASADAIFTYKDNFLLDIGDDGAFLCKAIPVNIDQIDTIFVTLNTWLPEHMGVSQYQRLPPAKERDDMLGAFHLMPPPLRHDKGESIIVPKAALDSFQ